MTTDGPAAPAPALTRAARRAAAPGSLGSPARQARQARPVVVAGAVATAAALAACALLLPRAGLLGWLAVAALALAAGWPALTLSASPRGSAAVLVATALALGVALLLSAEPPYLDHAAAALAVGVVAACLHPLLSPPAREDLLRVLGGSLLGVALLAAGAVLVSAPVGGPLPALVAALSVLLSAPLDLLTARSRGRLWALPAATLAGGLGGLLAGSVGAGGVLAWAVLGGMLTAPVALALREVLAQSRGVSSSAGGLAAGVGSVLVAGPAVAVLALATAG